VFLIEAIKSPSQAGHVRAVEPGGDMKAIRYLGMLAAAVALASIVAAQEVRTDWDKNAVFERYHTYSWGRVRTSNPLWEPRIEEVVDKELSGKGWHKVEDGGDIVMMAVGATQNLQEYQTFYDGMGGWRWGGFGETTTTVQNYRVGTLVLDMYTTNDKHLIWRGTASDTISDTPERNEKNLDKAVDKMFKKFPPKK
jgi:hypothetical protein